MAGRSEKRLDTQGHEIELRSAGDLDLDDVILAGLADTVMRLGIFSEGGGIKIKMGESELNLCVSGRDVHMTAEERLAEIVGIGRDFVHHYKEVELADLVKAVLNADGWSLTPYALRTPLWMLESREIERDDLHEIGGLAWLAQCTSL